MLFSQAKTPIDNAGVVRRLEPRNALGRERRCNVAAGETRGGHVDRARNGLQLAERLGRFGRFSKTLKDFDLVGKRVDPMAALLHGLASVLLCLARVAGL